MPNAILMNAPEVTTARLRLRRFTDDDAPALHAILQQPNILQYFPTPSAMPMERVQRLIAYQDECWAKYGRAWWAVEPLEGAGLIGWCGLGYLPETDETEVAYLLSQPHHGKGLATEAARASLEWGYAALQLDRIIGLVHPDNEASRNVLLKLGMEYEGDYPYFGMTLRRYAIARQQFAHERSRNP